MTVQNTSALPAAVHMVGMLGGSTDYIEGQERQGQAQVVHSDLIPTDLSGGKEPFEALGFVFGDVVPNDPLFQHCTLPAGWSRKGTSHSMHSDIVDERGIARVGVFYKAAFYDRNASAHVVNVGYAAARNYIYHSDTDPDPVFGAWGVLTREELADAESAAINYVADAERHPDIYGDRLPRAEQVLSIVETALAAQA